MLTADRLRCHLKLPFQMPSVYGIMRGDMKNFHLPLPERTYSLLKAHAQRAHLPATTLAREAIDAWLQDQVRRARHDAISAYAAEMAGTHFDLDRELESAGIDHLMRTARARK